MEHDGSGDGCDAAFDLLGRFVDREVLDMAKCCMGWNALSTEESRHRGSPKGAWHPGQEERRPHLKKQQSNQ